MWLTSLLRTAARVASWSEVATDASQAAMPALLQGQPPVEDSLDKENAGKYAMAPALLAEGGGVRCIPGLSSQDLSAAQSNLPVPRAIAVGANVAGSSRPAIRPCITVMAQAVSPAT